MVFLWLIVIPIVPSSISNWLIWQNLKEGTILPVGSVTKKYGQSIGWCIKLAYIAFLLIFSFQNKISYILTFVPVWFIAGWLATLLERMLYSKKVYNIIINHLSYYDKGLCLSTEYINHIVPGWWLKLMSQSWKYNFYQEVANLRDSKQ